MRHIRLRLRSSIYIILAILTILFLTTLYTAIWSTKVLDPPESSLNAPLSPNVIPFWSAINHQNIYDLHATPANTIFIRRSNITQHRIDELFQLIRNARTDEVQLTNKDKLFPIDPKWNFEKLVAQQQSTDHEDGNKQNPETHADTADSAAKTTKTTTTIHPDLTTTEKTVSEHDKIQLRNYIHRVLSNWKKEHQNDKIVTIADLMHDELLREEPS
jgi:hypothetical protein